MPIHYRLKIFKMKFKNLYNRNSPRLENYDYSNGIFFVTICTANRTHFFGKILDGEMQLSDEGEIVSEIWNSVSTNFDNVESGVFVIIPNHFHSIISIIKNHSSTLMTDNIQQKGGFAGTMNPMLNENLSTVIRWFKAKCTYEIRKINKGFSWQSRFHEHIIRNETSFRNIENYIINNPKNWDSDSLK